MNNATPAFDAIAGLTDMKFNPVRRCERSAFSTSSHYVSFEFKIDGKIYWGECHRARLGAAGYGYDSWIRSLDRNNRSYAIGERALPAVREEIAAHVAGMVRDYARAIDATPTPAPTTLVPPPSAPRRLLGGFATSGNIAPIGRAYRAGELDSFQVAAILEWMPPARLAAFYDRWAA